MITMHDVESSQLAKIGRAKETLHIIFVGGTAEYRYADVPAPSATILLNGDY